MFIDEEELQKRLNSPNNLLNRLGIGVSVPKEVEVITIPEKVNTPKIKSTELKVIAGVCGKVDGNKVAARELGLTENQVNSAKNSTDKGIASLVEQKVLNVEELALQRTIEALGLLTPELVGNEKPKDIAAIAANMSRVVANVRRGNGAVDNRTQFIVYAPSLKNESHYGIIESSVA